MATLGQQLKQSREEKGISLHEIAESTHIGVRFLQAIESDSYDILPGGVFNRAFVRKFARKVGFDEEQAVKLYEEQLEEQGGEPEQHYQLGVEDFESRPTSGNGLLLSFVALMILGALAYAAYQYFTPAASDSGGSSTVSLNTPTPEATATPAASPTPEATPGGPMRVQLSAPIEEVWIRVKPDDQKVQETILQTGEVREYDVNEKIILSIGRVPSLKISINGRAIDNNKLLPNLKGIIATNVVITKDNYQQFLN
ncbi:MAG: helix-turn-helix domain-containing protein [Blastocatellales bacterium]